MPAPPTRYVEFLRQIFKLRAKGVKLELDRVEQALEPLGHPQRGLRVVHIAGTNGKGSTAAFVDAMVRAAGYRVGLFTSPHLNRFTERIRVDGEEISPDDAVRLADEIWGRIEVPVTFFETATLLAFLYFRERATDAVVLETGMGGRLDATNVVDPLVTVITGVALDHVRPLGGTLAAIAREKAGILKPGCPVVAAAAPGPVRDTITAEAARVGAPVSLLGVDFDLVDDGAEDGSLLFTRGGSQSFRVPTPGLRGRHQQRNAALALAAAAALEERGLPVPVRARQQGIAECRWPGRFEEVSRAPRIVLDAAHNPDGAKALAATLRAESWRRLVLCIGVLRDKDVAGIVSHLSPLADQIVTVPPPSDRALEPDALAALIPGAEALPSLEAALARLRPTLAADDLCVVAGSICLVGEARRLLLDDPADEVVTGDPTWVAVPSPGP